MKIQARKRLVLAAALVAMTGQFAIAMPASATPGLRGIGRNAAETCRIMQNNMAWNYFRWRLTGRFYHYEGYYTEFLTWRSACQ